MKMMVSKGLEFDLRDSQSRRAYAGGQPFTSGSGSSKVHWECYELELTQVHLEACEFPAAIYHLKSYVFSRGSN